MPDQPKTCPYCEREPTIVWTKPIDPIVDREVLYVHCPRKKLTHASIRELNVYDRRMLIDARIERAVTIARACAIVDCVEAVDGAELSTEHKGQHHRVSYVSGLDDARDQLSKAVDDLIDDEGGG